MTARALPLPGFDIHLPICPGCKRPVSMLGQVVPAPSSAYLCRDCTLRYPFPDVFEVGNNSIGIVLKQGAEWAAAREQYHAHIKVLEELKRGCMHSLDDVSDDDYLPCMTDDDLWIMNAYSISGRGWQRDILVNFERTRQCRRCMNRLRYVVSQREQAASWIAHHRDGTATAYTRGLPVCARCGCVHDRQSLSGDYEQYCQRCEDEVSVESLFQHRGIFGGDDDESVLDRLQAAFPGLFERGVLPDMWFVLRVSTK